MHEEQQHSDEEMNALQPIASDTSVNDLVSESPDESLALYTIENRDTLFRRFPIVNEPNYISFWKEVNGQKVPTSAVFKTKPFEDGLSVDIKALTGDPLKFNLCELPASVPINLGKECLHNPKDDNHAHALIIGDTKNIAKKLQLSAIVIMP